MDALQGQLDAARDPATTAAELDGLADSFYPFVVRAVAEHANTAPATLARIAMSAPRQVHPEALELVARHPSTPAETLLEVAALVRGRLNTARENEADARVGRALIRRPEVPTEVVRSLLTEPTTSTGFRALVAGGTTRDDVRELLAHDRSSHVRQALKRSRTDLG